MDIALEDFVDYRLAGGCYCEVTDTELIIVLPRDFVTLPKPLLDLSRNGDAQLYKDLLDNRLVSAKIDVISGGGVNL